MSKSNAFWWRRWAAAAVVAGAIALWAGWAPGEHVVAAGSADLGFTLKDVNGHDVRLADFRGRPLILSFWATWCGPCRTEIPIFNDLVEQYKAQQLTVLGISVDDSADDIRQFTAGHPMNYPVLLGLGQDRLQETYDSVMFIPITWLIRADGTVFLKQSGPASREWFENQVKALIAPTPPVSQ